MRSDPVPQVTGRTGYDFLHQNRLGLLILIAVIGLIVCVKVFDLKLDVSDYIPFIIAFAIGYYSGRHIVSDLLDVPYVILKEIGQEDRTCRSYAVPLSLFSQFNQSGNGFELHDGPGRPVYFCDEIDWENFIITYSWPFSRPFYEVLTNIDYYNKIIEDYNSLCVEVIHSRKHLASIMLRQTRSVSKELMDELSSVISGCDEKDGDIFRDTIFEAETDLDFPENISQEIIPEEEDHDGD